MPTHASNIDQRRRTAEGESNRDPPREALPTLDTARDGADVVRLGGDVLEREDGFAVTPGPEGTLRVAESPLEPDVADSAARFGDLTDASSSRAADFRAVAAPESFWEGRCAATAAVVVRGAETSVRGAEASDSTGRQTDLSSSTPDALALDGAEEGGLASAAPKELGGPGGLGRGRAAVLACFSGRGAVHGERGDAGRVARRAAADAQTAREKHGGATRTVTPSMTNAVDLGGDASDEGDRRRGAREWRVVMLLDVVFQVVPVLEVVIVRLVQIPRLVVEGIDRQVRRVVVLIVRVVARERRRGSAVAKDIVEGRANRRIPRLSSARASGARRGRPEGDEVSRRARE